MKNILLLGSEERVAQFMELPIQNANITSFADDDVNANLEDYDVIIDLNLDDNPENLEEYNQAPGLTVIGCAVKESLGSMVYGMGDALQITLIGMNAIPSFINRDKLELSLYSENDREAAQGILQDLGLSYEIVADRAGMVTPRIVCMIINEACYVLGEGTADIAATNQAMKLGTNYPHGPFEWADLIGIDNVFEILEAVGQETGEEKYKIAPELRRRYLREESFA